VAELIGGDGGGSFAARASDAELLNALPQSGDPLFDLRELASKRLVARAGDVAERREQHDYWRANISWLSGLICGNGL